MNEIDLKTIIESKSPGYFDRYPNLIAKLIIKFLEKVLHLNEINQFLAERADKKGFDFIDEVFDYLDFNFLLSNKDRLKIPSEGRLICVANHPLGALDGLAILKAISSIRHDVRIVANDVLMNIKNMSDLFLPFDLLSIRPQKNQINRIKQSLVNEEAVIFFPASEVSRLSLRGIHDRKWLNGPIYFAQKNQVPILPIYVKGKNSYLFYFMSFVYHKFSMFLLAHEIFRQRPKTITLKIGDPIPGNHFKANIIDTKFQTTLLKRHVYLIGKNKSGVFKTEKTIIHPIDRRSIKNELTKSKLLTITSNDHKIFLVDYEQSPNIIREIARLREVTFRKVGEGTGLKFDFDEYDRYYKHIVLWDDEALEIIGSYRLCVCRDVIKNYGTNGLYNASLFNFTHHFDPYLDKAIELGRSFIQQKYWKSNALDYLWQGIGAFLLLNPDITYLFGAVSISENYSDEAKSLIVYYYQKWFSPKDETVTAKNKYIITNQQKSENLKILSSQSYEQDFVLLKSTLRNYGYSVPILFRKYTDLCEQDGVKFLDFCVDVNFSNTVDGLALLDLNKLKPQKRKRYFRTDSG